MFNIYEKYVRKCDILYFSKDSNNDNVQPVLSIDNGHVYIHLGNSISITYTQRSMINNAIADVNIKSNNLLANFAFSNSLTLSLLFES